MNEISNSNYQLIVMLDEQNVNANFKCDYHNSKFNKYEYQISYL